MKEFESQWTTAKSRPDYLDNSTQNTSPGIEDGVEDLSLTVSLIELLKGADKFPDGVAMIPVSIENPKLDEFTIEQYFGFLHEYENALENISNLDNETKDRVKKVSAESGAFLEALRQEENAMKGGAAKREEIEKARERLEEAA